MRGLKKDMKKDSYMGDVKIIKKIDDIPELKEQLIDIFESKSHRDISHYSLLLAEHILSLTNTPVDDAIAKCFDIVRKWQDGKAKFQEARQVAFMLHRLARMEKDPIKVKVLRVM